jgi:exosortase
MPAARAALFPLAFLLFMVPLPPILLAGVVGGLQRASAELSAAVFGLLGVPLYREGFVFALPGLTIEVAAECSGIRSFMALVVTSVLAVHLVLRRAWTRTTLLLLLAPLAVAKNAVRIVGLSLLAIHVDRGFVTGSALHRYGGIPLFITALVVLAGLLALLVRAEGRATSDGRA